MREGQMMSEVGVEKTGLVKGMVVFSKPREGSSGTSDAAGAKKKRQQATGPPKFLALPLPGLPGSMPLPPCLKPDPPRHLEGTLPLRP